MTELHPEIAGEIADFLAGAAKILHGHPRLALARPANPRAGADPMADIEVLIVADEVTARELYRIWELASEFAIKDSLVLSVQVYSSADFNARRNLPVIRGFLNEGVELDVQ